MPPMSNLTAIYQQEACVNIQGVPDGFENNLRQHQMMNSGMESSTVAHVTPEPFCFGRNYNINQTSGVNDSVNENVRQLVPDVYSECTLDEYMTRQGNEASQCNWMLRSPHSTNGSHCEEVQNSRYRQNDMRIPETYDGEISCQNFRALNGHFESQDQNNNFLNYENTGLYSPPSYPMYERSDISSSYMTSHTTSSMANVMTSLISLCSSNRSEHSLYRPIRSRFQADKVPSSAPKNPSSVARRNARERKRIKNVNQAFDDLRKKVPCGSRNSKISKVETLRSAIEYIRALQTLANEKKTKKTIQVTEHASKDPDAEEQEEVDTTAEERIS